MCVGLDVKSAGTAPILIVMDLDIGFPSPSLSTSVTHKIKSRSSTLSPLSYLLFTRGHTNVYFSPSAYTHTCNSSLNKSGFITVFLIKLMNHIYLKSQASQAVKHHLSFIAQCEPLLPITTEFRDCSHDPRKPKQFCEPDAFLGVTAYLKFCKIQKTSCQSNEKEWNFVLNTIIHRGFKNHNVS